MTESELASGGSALEETDTNTFYAAVGIPQGLIADQESGEVAGAVRRGGHLVSLGPAEYGLWVLLLTPLPRLAAVEAASSNELADADAALAGLEERGLVVTITPGASMDDRLAGLRPIPLGVALGNRRDHTQFEIQNASLSLSSPLAVDPASIMLWWEFDGTRPLRDAVSEVASALPDLPAGVLEAGATRLVYGLLGNRLLYLDAASNEGSRR